MSIRAMSANPETLLFLAWAVRAGLRETMIEVHNQRGDPEQALRKSVPVLETSTVYKALFAYRLDRVEFRLVAWALRGFNAVYLREPSEKSHGGTTPETAIVWEALMQEEYSGLLSSLKWDTRTAANVLRSHFRFPFDMRDRPFLFVEFICMSLEQVNWAELAKKAVRLTLPQDRQICGGPLWDLQRVPLKVTARCTSDDSIIEVRFDATFWFFQASDDELRALRKEGYGGGYTADSVAEFAATYDAHVKGMLDYYNSLPDSVELRGFECHVNELEAKAWLAQHRPHVLREGDAYDPS